MASAGQGEGGKPGAAAWLVLPECTGDWNEPRARAVKPPSAQNGLQPQTVCPPNNVNRELNQIL
ncbi:MAG: hypothetical protein JW735_04225 [Prolixibacteraceae bacterium]|nr:hypothetical protein [Prolixibacteraceae bacterium]